MTSPGHPIYLALALTLCASCAPPGYHYNVGEFTPTPDTTPALSAQTQDGSNLYPSPNCYAAARPCGPLLQDLSPEDRAAAEANMRRLQAQEDQRREQMDRTVACANYKVRALESFVFKTQGRSLKFTLDFETAKAYGPQGEALRNSSENEKALEGIVEAAYSNNPDFGNNASAFGDYAYKLCMNGERF